LPSSRWALTLKPRELKESLGKDVSSISVVARSETGRARRVKLGPERTLDAVSLRERIGYTRLKSLSFEVAKGPHSEIRISGKGYGHGAGLCQWGAKSLADQGWDYRRILGHYYPGAELQTLY
jgi:stage II sporulation protein D